MASIANMTKEEKLSLADELINRDAETWRNVIRGSDNLLYDIISRRNDKIILFPKQR